jgi:hypothetical protein
MPFSHEKKGANNKATQTQSEREERFINNKSVCQWGRETQKVLLVELNEI